jgi:hypothetical protein
LSTTYHFSISLDSDFNPPIQFETQLNVSVRELLELACARADCWLIDNYDKGSFISVSQTKFVIYTVEVPNARRGWWDDFEASARAIIPKGKNDRIMMNRFSGLVAADVSPSTCQRLTDFITKSGGALARMHD